MTGFFIFLTFFIVVVLSAIKDNIMSNVSRSYECYIVIKSIGIFYGGRPASLIWQGGYISMPKGLKKFILQTKRDFRKIQEISPDVQELHFVESKTKGIRFKPGNPVPGYNYVWCRVKFNNGKIGRWIFCGKNDSVYACGRYIKPGDYIKHFIYNTSFRSAVLRNNVDNVNTNDVVCAEQDDQKTYDKIEQESDKQPKTMYTLEENLERIATSLEKIVNILQIHFGSQR